MSSEEFSAVPPDIESGVGLIRFNWESGWKFEEAFGQPFLRAIQMMMGIRLVTYIAWAGLLHHNPKITIEQVRKKIQAYLNRGGDIEELSVQLGLAIERSGILGRKKKDSEEAGEAGESDSDPQVATE